MTTVCGLFLLASIALTGTIFKRRLLNPLLLFFSSFFFALICYELGIWRDILPGGGFSYSYAELLFVASVVAFFIGSVVVALIAGNKKPSVLVQIDARESEGLYKMVWCLLILSGISIASRYTTLLGRYSAPMTDISFVRYDYTRMIYHFGLLDSLAFTLNHLVVLDLGILVAIRGVAKFKLVLVGSIVCIVLNDIAVGAANQTFQLTTLFLITALLSYESLANRRIRWKQVAQVFAVLALVSVIVFAIFNWRKGRDLLADPEALDTLLFYAGGNVASLSYFVDHPMPSPLPGRHVFGGLYALANDFSSVFGSSFLAPVSQAADKEYSAVFYEDSPYNTSIYVSYYYSDFGGIGAIVMSCVLGAVLTYFFFRALQRRTILDMQLSALLLYDVFCGIRGAGVFGGRYSWFVLFLLFAQRWWLPNRTKRRNAIAPLKTACLYAGRAGDPAPVKAQTRLR